MLKKVLVANRGEVAIRIIRALKELGIGSCSVYSTADKDQVHVTMADESVCIGPPRPGDSYLNMDNIISAALGTNCDGIHPGYGFLSENAEFAKKVTDAGLTFIGPSHEVIGLMGNKSRARDLMQAHGIRTVPGSDGVVKDAKTATKIAKEIGLPVLIKAVAGGGGRGMRLVTDIEKIETLYYEASQEADIAFGNGDVYIEKFIEDPKHIEVQVISDKYQNHIHLGERDCSIQRNKQKLIEEAPSYRLGEDLRQELGQAAIQAAKAASYEGVGTVEFIVDSKKNYYFIEMNTRLQVEHPVTEMITGIDIVKEQIKIASGLRLKHAQEDIDFRGHAIEVRLNAEDVKQNFLPQTGTISFFQPPGGISTRFDSHIYTGCEIGPYYDSMIGKIIVHGPTRLEAIKRMRRALEETFVSGIETNLPLHYAILHDICFLKADYTTSYIDEKIQDFVKQIEEATSGQI